MMEIVFKNKTLDLNGTTIELPRQGLINDCQLEMLSPYVGTSDLRSFLRKLNSVSLSEMIKTCTVFVSLFCIYTFAYPVHKWQQDSVSGLILTSIEPEAQKTSIMKFIVKCSATQRLTYQTYVGQLREHQL